MVIAASRVLLAFEATIHDLEIKVDSWAEEDMLYVCRDNLGSLARNAVDGISVVLQRRQRRRVNV